MEDGRAFGLLHGNLRAAQLRKQGNVELSFGLRNLTDTQFGNPMYRDKIDEQSGEAARYPGEIAGEGRHVQASVEVRF